MSGCTIYAFIFLLYFSRYTTSLQTPGNTMKTLKCKYGAIKALLNVRLCARLQRGMLARSQTPSVPSQSCCLAARGARSTTHLRELGQMLKVPIDFPGGGGSKSWLLSQGFPAGLSPWLQGAGGHSPVVLQLCPPRCHAQGWLCRVGDAGVQGCLGRRRAAWCFIYLFFSSRFTHAEVRNQLPACACVCLHAGKLK